jgi:integrase
VAFDAFSCPASTSPATSDRSGQILYSLKNPCLVPLEKPPVVTGHARVDKDTNCSSPVLPIFITPGDSSALECRSHHFTLGDNPDPAFGKLKLAAITVREIEQLKAKVLAAELSRKRANNILAVLSKIIHYARDIGILETVPTVKLLKLPPAKFDFLTFDELEGLLDGAGVEPTFRAAILVGAEAGLRMGEIIGLEWDDVDFRNRTLTVMRSEWQGHVGPPKGGRARTIPLTERLAEALKGEPHLRGPRIFCLEGGEHWHRHNMRKGLARACKRAKLRAIGWHVLRHTFCSHLAMRGAVSKAIQELAGHTTLAVTLRYMHLAPSALRGAIQLLDRPAWQNRAKTGEQAEAINAQMGAKWSKPLQVSLKGVLRGGRDLNPRPPA